MVVVLMAGGALLLRTLLNLEHADRGYRADRVLTFHISLPASRYSTPEAKNLFIRKPLHSSARSPAFARRHSHTIFRSKVGASANRLQFSDPTPILVRGVLSLIIRP